jgi:hypothetical protein
MEAGSPPKGQEELARGIYMDLVGRSFEPADGKLRLKSDTIARLSLQLAADFYESKESVETAATPKKEEFNLDTLLAR